MEKAVEYYHTYTLPWPKSISNKNIILSEQLTPIPKNGNEERKRERTKK